MATRLEDIVWVCTCGAKGIGRAGRVSVYSCPTCQRPIVITFNFDRSDKRFFDLPSLEVSASKAEVFADLKQSTQSQSTQFTQKDQKDQEVSFWSLIEIDDSDQKSNYIYDSGDRFGLLELDLNRFSGLEVD